MIITSVDINSINRNCYFLQTNSDLSSVFYSDILKLIFYFYLNKILIFSLTLIVTLNLILSLILTPTLIVYFDFLLLNWSYFYRKFLTKNVFFFHILIRNISVNYKEMVQYMLIIIQNFKQTFQNWYQLPLIPNVSFMSLFKATWISYQSFW